jgi:hypothetical protein
MASDPIAVPGDGNAQALYDQICALINARAHCHTCALNAVHTVIANIIGNMCDEHRARALRVFLEKLPGDVAIIAAGGDLKDPIGPTMGRA